MSKSYSATMIVNGTTGKPIAASGSFRNISIDGRLSLENAKNVAREAFKKEGEYMGFAIERTEKFVEYKNPVMVDTVLKSTDVAFLF
ncbi:hypothetical protein XaC1_3 [Xanthomonas phage XaC1]|nr:hypothetical protein XaC1_3 [Xanthomonas phage XaC1]